MSTPGFDNTAMRKQYHHGGLREALLEAALTSLDATRELPSWRALARACAVSHTAPYRHFGNVEALQVALATAGFNRLTAAVIRATTGIDNPFERLAQGLKAYVTFGRAHPSWYELMFGQVKSDDAELTAAGAAAYGTLIEGIAACQIAEPADVAFTLWCAIHGITDLGACGLKAPVSGRRKRDQVEDVIAMCVNHVQSLARRTR